MKINSVNITVLCFCFLQSCNQTVEKTFYNPFDFDILYGNVQWVDTEYFHIKYQNGKIIQGVKDKNDIHRRQFFTKRKNDWNWHYYLCKKDRICSGMYDITINPQHQLKSIYQFDSTGGDIETEYFNQITDSTAHAIVHNIFWKTKSSKFYQFKNQRPIKEIWFDPDSIMIVDISYLYDKHDYIKEKKEIYIQEKDTLIYIFECDKWGHPIKKQNYKNRELVAEWTYQYELDNHHNWTKAIVSVNNNPTYMVNQKLVYSSAVKNWNQ